MSDAGTLAKQIEKELRARGTEERAAHEKQYLKSALTHFGTPVPEIRRIAKAAAKAAKMDADAARAVADALFARPIHETRMAAIEVLRAKVRDLGKRDLPRIERMLRAAKTWAIVDSLAAEVVGAIAAKDDVAKTLDRWAADPDFWVRRAAMLSLLVPLRRGEGDFERFARYADAMLAEKEFFIQKAIGWILRETSKKRPELVADWVEPRARKMGAVAIREAIKYLPDERRARILGQRQK